MIRVGHGAARIVEVSDDHIVFADAGGVRHVIDLADCRAAMVERSAELAVGPFVALRSVAGPPFRVILPGSPDVCFEFDTAAEAYRELVEPLRAGGWRTSDID